MLLLGVPCRKGVQPADPVYTGQQVGDAPQTPHNTSRAGPLPLAIAKSPAEALGPLADPMATEVAKRRPAPCFGALGLVSLTTVHTIEIKRPQNAL